MTDDWQQRILALVKQPNYRPVKPRLLAELLDISGDDLRDFKRFVKKLVKRGELNYGAKHMVLPPGGVAEGGKTAAKQSHHGVTIAGRFQRTAGGFGFVRPSGAGPAHDRAHDFYIAVEHSLDAATGDLVLIRPLKDHHRGRGRRGQIVEIIERQTRQFVGTYFEQVGQAYVQIDGTVFKQPIPLSDPTAKNAQADDKIVVEIVRFPTHLDDGEAVITQVLGARGEPGVDTLSIIHEFNLPDHFPEEVLAAARVEADRFDETVRDDRQDLTNETIITIDPIDARDYDDAISLRQLSNGHWLLGVHIADVAHFVPQGTALDREAYERGTSVYLPDRVLPMLPELISNGLASLQPDRVRFTKTAQIEFTPDGAVVAVDLSNSAIKSCRRFTYEEVDEYLADPATWKAKLAPEVHSLLGRMHELAMILRSRRMKRGALELAMSEVKIDLDKEGRVCGARQVVNTVSHQIIEEFMLAANMAVAEQLFAKGVLFLRRVHPDPNPLKLKALTDFAKDLGFRVESLESRFELQKLLDEVKGQPTEAAVNYAVLRSLARAVYAPDEEGHFALASDCYCHFTSPIRRYPDLTIHRLVDAVVKERRPKGSEGELIVVGEHCSQRERRAESAERELKKVKILLYLESRIGLELDAVITGVEEYGLYAQGKELPAEGLIRVSTLADDYYHFEKSSHSLTGRRSGNAFRLGDPVRVEVARVDIERRELDLRLVSRDKKKRPEVAQKPKPDRPTRKKPEGRQRQENEPAPRPTKKKQRRKRQ